MRNLPSVSLFTPFSRMADRDFVSDMMRSFLGEQRPANTWTPSADVYETPTHYVLTFDVPGFDPNQIEISLVGETLTVSGERTATARAENEREHLSERSYGKFTRTFTFPAAVAGEEVDASAKNGVLEIRVAKAKEAQPKKVKIRS